MFKNYLKTAWRSLLKSKGYSAINIFGLAVGLAACLLIVLYVSNELSYDRYNEKADRIYRINADIHIGGSNLHLALSSDVTGKLLKQDYAEVEEYARVYNQGGKLVKKGNTFIDEPRVAYVDSTIFNVFTLPAVEGNTITALTAPDAVVISETASKKYFGTTHSLGKTIEMREGDKVTPYNVTAVIKDMPHASHIDFDFLFPIQKADYPWGQVTSHNFYTYLLLRPGTDYKAFEKHFEEYQDKYVVPFVKQFADIKSMDEFKKAGNWLEYSLMPLTKIHLYSDYTYELKPSGSIQHVYIFSAVALFILLIACINFMNLSTARSAKRAKEVGIRKVLGTERKTLIAQFLVESTITALIALVTAIGIAYLVLPMFNNVTAQALSLAGLASPKLLPFILITPIAVGVLAGCYPAFYLSSFSPNAVLKSNTAGGFKKSFFRNALVVFQFATSIILIIGTIVVYTQLKYIQSTPLGFNKDQVLIIDRAYALNNQVQSFKDDVLGLPGVSSATVSSYLPVGGSSRNDNSYSTEAVMTANNALNMQTWRVDYDYVKTMGMQMAQGRNFSPDYGTDSTALILNETAARMFGFDDPVGKTVYAPVDNSSKDVVARHVIGIVKDFYFESFRQRTGPLALKLQSSTGTVAVKVSAASAASVVKNIESVWKTLAPAMPFSYRFMNDAFDEMYRSEQRAGTVAMVFSILAIVIACMGLLGLVTYMAEQRRKEIGIRKVLGATVSNVVVMISREFLWLVAIAALIAFPLAWWAMHSWLQGFAYRINISAWVFVAAGAMALLIALITVSFRAITAALANPVKSLRSE